MRKVQVWILDSALKKVLLLKLNRKRGAFWQPVTGGVDDGEASVQGAAREVLEETGIRGRPRSTGFRFSFEGRWGPAREIVYALRLKKSEGLVKPRLDPREHVQARWVTPAQARRLVKFESNRKGLAAALEVFRILFLALLLSAEGAEAAQRVRVGPAPIAAFRLPSRQSDILETLGQGTDLLTSEQPFGDARGIFWYKVRLANSQTAYVEAKGVSANQSGSEIRAAGIAKETVESEPRKESEWAMHLRTAFLGGMEASPGVAAALGGDAEFSVNVLLRRNGYFRRFLAVAVSFTAVPWQTQQWILAGGAVFRVFSYSLLEPEVRVRAGYEFTTASFIAAPSFGYRLQLGTNPRVHFTWFWDLGCWLGPGATGATAATVLPFLMSGFGLSF